MALKVIYQLLVALLAACSVGALDTEVVGSLYNIKYHYARIPEKMADQLSRNHAQDSYGVTFEKLKISKDGEEKEYLCSFPPNREEHSTEELLEGSGNETSSDSREMNDKLLSDAIKEIEKSFPKNQCVFAYDLNAGYWTYAYCYGDKIIQYHESAPVYSRSKAHKAAFPDYVYTLGRHANHSMEEVKIENQGKDHPYLMNPDDFKIEDYDESPFLANVVQPRTHNKQKIIKHRIGNGATCDLTNEPRTIDVVYKCDPNNNRGKPEISAVNEVKTCQYEMIINTPRLCLMDEFVPHNIVEDKIVDVDCKLISRDLTPKDDSFDFYQYLEETPSDRFPVPKDYKITLTDFNLGSIGNGFYFGLIKENPNTDNLYFNFRHVIVYNGFFESLHDLLKKVGSTIGNRLDVILAPVFHDDKQRPLAWNDTFSIWFELYDFNGDFITLARLERDGTSETQFLSVTLVDHETMLDQDGDPVEFDLSNFQAPNDAWNFEFYQEGERTQETTPVDQLTNIVEQLIVEPEVVVETVTVTETVNPNDLQATQNAEDDVVLEFEHDEL